MSWLRKGLRAIGRHLRESWHSLYFWRLFAWMLVLGDLPRMVSGVLLVIMGAMLILGLLLLVSLWWTDRRHAA